MIDLLLHNEQYLWEMMKRTTPPQVKLQSIENDVFHLKCLQLKLKNHRLRRQLVRQHQRVQLQTLRHQSRGRQRRDWMIFCIVLLFIYLLWQWMGLERLDAQPWVL
jgi:hypothetical protein